MTDIATVIYWDGRRVERTLMESVNACVRHRNPDGAWAWVDGSVGMAQTDLATLPEDEPGVPVVSESLRIVASCRIDNRDRIKKTIPREFFPQSGTDAALILAAYQAWGEDCINHLIGDFAFIIWDGYKQRIYAARDISGVRQLYYYCDKHILFLASDRTQILQDSTVPFEVDEAQLIEYLTPTYGWYSGWDQGFFRGFRALPAGSILRVERDYINVRSFWEWQEYLPHHQQPKKQVIEEYLHTLEEVVKCRLRSRSPVGIELSGGLDSSAVASIAARATKGSGPNLHTFSEIFEEVPEVNERDRIQTVLDRYPLLSPHLLVSDRLYHPQCLDPDWSPKSVTGPHEITLPQTCYPFHNTVVQTGCHVLLTGQMGDAINEGTSAVYFDLLRRGRIREFCRWFKISWARSKREAFRRLFAYGLVPLVTPFPLLRLVNFAREHWYVDSKLPAYLSKDFRRRLHRKNLAIQWQREKRIRVRCPSTRWTLHSVLSPMIGVTWQTPYPLEIRHPYFDRRIVEFALSMPSDLKWDPRETKTVRAFRYHHRKALAGILPEQVLVGNLGVDFGPAVDFSFSRTTFRNWLMNSRVIHIFERGNALPDMFLAEFEKSTAPTHNFVDMLGLEAFLRSVAAGGQMHQLIPPRTSR